MKTLDYELRGKVVKKIKQAISALDAQTVDAKDLDAWIKAHGGILPARIRRPDGTIITDKDRYKSTIHQVLDTLKSETVAKSE